MTHWSERPEGGNRLWLTMIRWCVLHIGRGFAQPFMLPTALYFYCRRGVERRASRLWLERIEAPTRGFAGVIRHIYTFAMTIVDRVLLLAGRDDELDIRVEGVEALHDTLAKEGRGCVLLGSHLGSFDAIRVFNRKAPPAFRRLKVVMDRQQNTLLTQMLEALDPGIAQTVIDARQGGPQIVLEAADTLAAGGMVAMLGDRAKPNERVAEVPFAGQKASFPVAPLAIATALDAPVYLVFGLYQGKRRYQLIFEPLPPPGPRPESRRGRREWLNLWVASYAQRLEHHAKANPYNWFNFYDFWNTDDDTDARRQPGATDHPERPA